MIDAEDPRAEGYASVADNGKLPWRPATFRTDDHRHFVAPGFQPGGRRLGFAQYYGIGSNLEHTGKIVDHGERGESNSK